MGFTSSCTGTVSTGSMASLEDSVTRTSSCTGIVPTGSEAWYLHVSSHPSFPYNADMEANRVSAVPFS